MQIGSLLTNALLPVVSCWCVVMTTSDYWTPHDWLCLVWKVTSGWLLLFISPFFFSLTLSYISSITLLTHCISFSVVPSFSFSLSLALSLSASCFLFHSHIPFLHFFLFLPLSLSHSLFLCLPHIEPLFYRVRRGFHDNLARFFRAKKNIYFFFFFFFYIYMHLYYSGAIGDRLALQ